MVGAWWCGAANGQVGGGCGSVSDPPLMVVQWLGLGGVGPRMGRSEGVVGLSVTPL